MHHLIQRFINTSLLQFTKIAKRTHIHADQRNVAFYGISCRTYQRAVAAQYDHTLRLFRNILCMYFTDTFLFIHADQIRAASASCLNIAAQTSRFFQIPVF